MYKIFGAMSDSYEQKTLKKGSQSNANYDPQPIIVQNIYLNNEEMMSMGDKASNQEFGSVDALHLRKLAQTTS